MHGVDVEVMESPEERILKWLQETAMVKEVIPPAAQDGAADDLKEEFMKLKKTKPKAAKIHIHIPVKF